MGKHNKQKKQQRVQLELGVPVNTINQGPTQMSNTAATRIIKIPKEVPGFMSVLFQHKVVETTAKFNFTGPKISRELWNQILAYFHWVNDTTHSECQVRLYVNAVEQKWGAWAYPQEAKTGMTAKEIDNPAAQEQRQQFLGANGWLYFGTVHHHCSGDAFQSGTDEANEKGQDGLHITMGKIGTPKYNMHSRLYIGGMKFIPEMEWFWDIGDEVQVIPDWVKEFIPTNTDDLVARAQMCVPAPAGTEFPQQWKDNLIEIKAAPVTVYTGGGRGSFYDGGLGYVGGKRLWSYRAGDTTFDKDRATEEVCTWLKKMDEGKRPSDVAIFTMLEEMAKLDDHALDLLDICNKNDLRPRTLLNHLEAIEVAAEAAAVEKELASAASDGNPNGNGKANSHPMTQLEQEQAMEEYYEQQWASRGGSLPE